MTIRELPAFWRKRARQLKRYAPEVAAAMRDLARHLESAIEAEDNELLSPSAAAADPTISYTHPDSIGRLIRTDAVKNYGTRKRPLVRRGDLPRIKTADGSLSGKQVAPPSLERFSNKLIASTTNNGRKHHAS